MKWDPELGIWSLLDFRILKIHGTTPRNADVWSFDLDVNWPDFTCGVDIHYQLKWVRFTWWPGDRCRQFTLGEHNLHREFPFAHWCSCTCQDRSRPKTWLQKIRGPR